MNDTRVPHLDLAPRLDRPLQLWNPLDYVRLLYWCFFFPQAFNWYVETFGDPAYRGATRHDLWPALRADLVRQNLVLQGLILVLLVPTGFQAGLQYLGIPVHWFDLMSDTALIIMLGVSFSSGVASGVVNGVAFGVAKGMVEGVTLGVITGDVMDGVMFSVVFGIAFGIALSGMFNVTGGVALDITSGIVVGVVGSAIIGITLGIRFGVAFGVAGIATVGITTVRLPDFLFSAVRGHYRRERGISRVTALPLPSMQVTVENWLAYDWSVGVNNINQLLAYTLQFIPVVRGVNISLAKLPPEVLLMSVSQLAQSPFDWNLLHFGSASLRNALWDRVFKRLLIIPKHWRQSKFPIEPRLNTPARAACAGFWYLHEAEPEKATEAFSMVRWLPGGKSLYLSAYLLSRAQDCRQVADVTAWLSQAVPLAYLPGPFVRPDVIGVLFRLRDAAAEVNVALNAISPIMQSESIGRALANLTQLISEVEKICSQPEAVLIKKITIQWRDLLSAAWGIN